jgi:hypothetical protein
MLQDDDAEVNDLSQSFEEKTNVSDEKSPEVREMLEKLEHQKKQAIERMKIKDGWFWPCFIFNYKENSLDEGIYADFDHCPVRLDGYNLLPFPYHLVVGMDPMTANRIYMNFLGIVAPLPLFGDIPLPTPTLILTLSGKRSTAPHSWYQAAEVDLIETFGAKLEQSGMSLTEFSKTKEGKQIMQQYLAIMRPARLREAQANSIFQHRREFLWDSSLNVFLDYCKVRDLFQIWDGWMNREEVDQVNAFRERVNHANAHFVKDGELLEQKIWTEFPDLKEAVFDIHEQHVAHGLVVDWKTPALKKVLSEGILNQAIFYFTRHFIAAMEKCILSIAGMDPDMIPLFLNTFQPHPSPEMMMEGLPQLKVKMEKQKKELSEARLNMLKFPWSPITGTIHTMMMTSNKSHDKQFRPEQKMVLHALAMSKFPSSVRGTQMNLQRAATSKEITGKQLFSNPRVVPIRVFKDYRGEERQVFKDLAVTPTVGE